MPRSRIPEMVARCREIGKAHGLLVATYGHAGDGNLHCNVLFDGERERPAADAAVGEILRAAVDMGGTITGEHGVGLAKRDFLEYEQGRAVVALERRLKATFDPLGHPEPREDVSGNLTRDQAARPNRAVVAAGSAAQRRRFLP